MAKYLTIIFSFALIMIVSSLTACDDVKPADVLPASTAISAISAEEEAIVSETETEDTVVFPDDALTPVSFLFEYSNDAENLRQLFETLYQLNLDEDYESGAMLVEALLADESCITQALREDTSPKNIEVIMALYETLIPANADAATKSQLLSAKPEQSEVQVHTATTEELIVNTFGSVAYTKFPTGAHQLASSLLRPETTFYEVEYLEPGKEFGMKYHLFLWQNDHWCMLGPIWRTMDLMELPAPEVTESGADWIEFVSEESGFKVMLPVEPKVNVSEAARKFTANSDGSYYTILHFEGEVALSEDRIEAFLDSYVETTGGYNGYKLVDEQKTVIDGYPARSFSFDSEIGGNSRIISVVFIKDNHIYDITVGASKDKLDGIKAAFYDSFQLLDTADTVVPPTAPDDGIVDAEWATYEYPTAKFSAEFPAEPIESDADGYHSVLTIHNKVAYSVGVTDIKERLGLDPRAVYAAPEILFDFYKKDSPFGVPIAEETFNPNGNPGLNLIFEANISEGVVARYSVRMFLYQDSFYQIASGGDINNIVVEDITRFIGSFKLLD